MGGDWRLGSRLYDRACSGKGLRDTRSSAWELSKVQIGDWKRPRSIASLDADDDRASRARAAPTATLPSPRCKNTRCRARRSTRPTPPSRPTRSTFAFGSKNSLEELSQEHDSVAPEEGKDTTRNHRARRARRTTPRFARVRPVRAGVSRTSELPRAPLRAASSQAPTDHRSQVENVSKEVFVFFNNDAASQTAVDVRARAAARWSSTLVSDACDMSPCRLSLSLSLSLVGGYSLLSSAV